MKKKLIKITILVLLLVVLSWWHFGFSNLRIPGTYDSAKNTYSVFYMKKKLKMENGYGRITFYTPFKQSGIMDSTGKIIVPFIYDNTNEVRKDFKNILVLKNNRKGVVSADNKTIVPLEYDGVNFLPNGDIVLEKIINNKNFKKLVDKNGKEILPLEYSEIFLPNYESRKPFIAAEKGNTTYLLKENNLIEKKDYLIGAIRYYKDGAMIMVGYLTKDMNRKKNITYKYTFVDFSQKDSIKINKTEYVKPYYGLYGTNGEELLPLEYNAIHMHRNRFSYTAEKNKTVGVYNVTKKDWIAQPVYWKINGYNEYLPLNELITFEKKFYYTDQDGIILLTPKNKVIERGRDYILFTSKNKVYKLIYRKELKKFIWFRYSGK